jgi:hypothetical protein
VALLAVGASGYGLSLRLYLLAQRAFGAARTGSVFALAPFIGALGAYALGERAATPLLLAGGGLMAMGVLMHVLESHGHEHRHEALAHEHAHRHDDGHHAQGLAHGHLGVPEVLHSHWHRHDPPAAQPPPRARRAPPAPALTTRRVHSASPASADPIALHADHPRRPIDPRCPARRPGPLRRRGFSLFLRKAFIKGAGYTDDALDRPVIGIADTGSDYNPCHGNLPALMEAVKRGVMLAGGLPMAFPTISIHESFCARPPACSCAT